MYAKDYAYADSRLTGTIVRHASTATPVLVEGVSHGDGSTAVRFLLSGNRKIVKLRELDLSPVPLGYVNRNGEDAVWCCRVPKRNDWRQGLRDNTLYAINAFDRPEDGDLARCITNNYPKLKDAMNKGRLVAFSRDWAVSGTAIHHGLLGVVGHINNNELVLKDQYVYLKEDLEAAL